MQRLTDASGACGWSIIAVASGKLCRDLSWACDQVIERHLYPLLASPVELVNHRVNITLGWSVCMWAYLMFRAVFVDHENDDHYSQFPYVFPD